MMTVGEKVWNRLRVEGGFVWTLADGRKFVHFNKGCHCSPELRDLLKRHSEELKAFVDARHAEADRSWRRPALPTPLGQGSSQAAERDAPIGRDRRICECNADTRSPISGESAEKWNFSHRRGISGASIAAALVLSASLAASGEILQDMSGRLAVPVDLASALLTSSSSGSGEVSTQQTNGGMVWKRN